MLNKPNNESNLGDQSWMTYTSSYQDLLRGYSGKVVMTQLHGFRPKYWNWRSVRKLTSIYILGEFQQLPCNEMWTGWLFNKWC
jgi:hypothetical protein